MIVISQSLALSPFLQEEGRFPVIGWHSLLDPSSVAADKAEESHPASNLARPSTAERWQSTDTSEQYITFNNINGAAVDYLALARHNLGSGTVTVSVEAEFADFPGNWEELVEGFVPSGNGPILVRFPQAFPTRLRLRLQPSIVIPRIAVIFLGELLVMERGEPSGVTPIPFAHNNDVVRARAQSGDYLGSIVLRQGLKTSISFQYLTLDWYLANMQPFIDASLTQPFFYAWSPAEFPEQVGYAWTTADVRPVIDIPRRVDVSLAVEAVKV